MAGVNCFGTVAHLLNNASGILEHTHNPTIFNVAQSLYKKFRMKFTMIRKLLSLVFLCRCGDVVSQYALSSTQVASSKFETLPSNARMIPGDYVVMLSSTVDIDRFIATLNDYQLSTTNILYVYNHTIPSTLSGNGKSLQGLALSNVSDVGLQELLDSEFVAAIVPVC